MLVGLSHGNVLDPSLERLARMADLSSRTDAGADLNKFLEKFRGIDQTRSLSYAIREVAAGSGQELIMLRYAASLLLLLSPSNEIVARVSDQLKASFSGSGCSIAGTIIAAWSMAISRQEREAAFPASLQQCLAQASPLFADANRQIINLSNHNGADFSSGGFSLLLGADNSRVTTRMELSEKPCPKPLLLVLKDSFESVGSEFGLIFRQGQQETPRSGEVITLPLRQGFGFSSHVQDFIWAVSDLPRIGEVLRTFNQKCKQRAVF